MHHQLHPSAIELSATAVLMGVSLLLGHSLFGLLLFSGEVDNFLIALLKKKKIHTRKKDPYISQISDRLNKKKKKHCTSSVGDAAFLLLILEKK